MKGDEKTMMFFIFGLIFTLLIFVTIILPAFLRIAQGACWTNVNSALSDLDTRFTTLKAGETARVRVTLGNCVKSFILANRKDIPSDVNCKYGNNAVMIAVPNLGNVAQQAEKDAKGVKTVCQEIRCGDDCYSYLTADTKTLAGPAGNDAAADYCVVIEKISTTDYSVSVGKGECQGGATGGAGTGTIVPNEGA
jgi:hypothetical protein